MSLTSSGSRTDATPGSRWSLAATRPGPLAARLVAAALGVGIVGGMAAGCLTVLFDSTTVSPATRILAIALPLTLMAMIIRHLSLITEHGPSPSVRPLAWSAMATVVLAVVVVGWPASGAHRGDSIKILFSTMLVVPFFGALVGLVAGAMGAAVLVPAVLALRAARPRFSLRTAQFGLTGIAMLMTAAFALWIGYGQAAVTVAGMATTLAGAGAALTARWCLAGKRP